MLAALSFLVGLLLGVGAVALLGRRIDSANPSERPSALAWTGLGFGVVATLGVPSGLLMPWAAETLGFSMSTVPALPAWITIVFAFASIVAAIGAYVKRDRHWPTWAGIVIGGLPVLFWVWFLVAEIVTPHA